MRGIVFGADADCLIVKASAGDVRRYASGERVDVERPVQAYQMTLAYAVNVIREYGYEVERRPEQWQSYGWRIGDGTEPTAMVLLRTRCGCER